MKKISRYPAATAWWVFGGLLTLGVTYLVMREIPAMRREIHLLRM